MTRTTSRNESGCVPVTVLQYTCRSPAVYPSLSCSIPVTVLQYTCYSPAVYLSQSCSVPVTVLQYTRHNPTVLALTGCLPLKRTSCTSSSPSLVSVRPTCAWKCTWLSTGTIFSTALIRSRSSLRSSSPLRQSVFGISDCLAVQNS